MTQNFQAQKEIEVDGDKYIVQFYGPTFGLELHARLMSLLGQPLVKLFESFKGKSMKDILAKNDLDFDSLAESLQMIFAKIEPKELPGLIQEVLSSTFFSSTKSPVSETFETAFQGRYLHIYKLVVKTLGVQYADFFAGLRKRANAAKGVTASAGKNTER